MNFVAFDFETATESRNSACSIGLVVVQNGIISDKYYSLIKPPNNNFSENNIKIHGICPQDTENAPTFLELWNEIHHYFYDNLIVAHNIAFDLDVLKKSLLHYTHFNDNFRFDCTFNIFGENLAKVASSFGIEFTHHHALADAETCAKIYLKHLNNEVPDYSKSPVYLTKNETYGLGWHKAIRGAVLKPDFDSADPTNNFYRKKVVITGLFKKMTRQEIAEKLKTLGADVDTSVTPRTDFIIIGLEPGPAKVKKAHELISSGSSLTLLSEEDFISAAE
ncbi:MAG: 3'-5' exoribonuclease [Bacteroidia bacterium]|nr:3'-5' exoribonuclease [Bacteroidia bacterium]